MLLQACSAMRKPFELFLQQRRIYGELSKTAVIQTHSETVGLITVD